MSTPLFHHISADMDDEEQALANDIPPRAAPSNEAKTSVPVTARARAFVEHAIRDPDAPIVMFGFEWCEFCWSVRRLFDDAGVPFRSIEVDSTEYRTDDWGGDVLRALFDHTGARTVPQVFVGGEFIGGATDVLLEAQNHALKRRLSQLPAPIHMKPTGDPFAYLPSWTKRPALEPASDLAGGKI